VCVRVSVCVCVCAYAFLWRVGRSSLSLQIGVFLEEDSNAHIWPMCYTSSCTNQPLDLIYACVFTLKCVCVCVCVWTGGHAAVNMNYVHS